MTHKRGHHYIAPISQILFPLVQFPNCRTSINVVVGIDLSSQVHQNHTPMLFTDAISIAKSAAVNSEYTIAIQAVVEILQVYDR